MLIKLVITLLLVDREILFSWLILPSGLMGLDILLLTADGYSQTEI